MILNKKRIKIKKQHVILTGTFLKRVAIPQLFLFKIKNRILNIPNFKKKILFIKNSLILSYSLFFLNLNFFKINLVPILYYISNFDKFNKLYSFVQFDILTILNLLKIKIITFLFLFKFNIKKNKYFYITNNLCNSNYLFYNNSFTKNSFVNYFCFLKKIKKIFIAQKKYNIDCFIFKKKGSSFKRFDKVKNFLLFRTRKLLFLNKDNTFNNNFFIKLKRFQSKKKKFHLKKAQLLHKFGYSHIKHKQFKVKNSTNKYNYGNLNLDFFFKKFNFFFFKKKKIYNSGLNQKTLFLKKGFFSILLENRKIIKTINFFKFKKQKSITKFLKKKVFIPTKQFYLNNEFLLINILLRSQFFFFKTDVLFFFNKKLIFVNGSIPLSLQRVLSVGDRIQLVVSENYYYFCRTHKFFSALFLRKIKRKVFRMFKPKNDMYKQKSNYTPNWIFKMIHYYNDIPSFLEVDFTIMTIVIVCTPFKFYDYNFVSWVFLSAYLYRLYNWKRVN